MLQELEKMEDIRKKSKTEADTEQQKVGASNNMCHVHLHSIVLDTKLQSTNSSVHVDALIAVARPTAANGDRED